MKDIRKAARKFLEAVTELEQIMLPYMEAIVDGKAPIPEGLELKEVDGRYGIYTFHHNGREIVYLWKGAEHSTFLFTGLAVATLYGTLIPAYEEWVDVTMEAVRDE